MTPALKVDDDPRGKKLGPYAIVDIIGKGGMAHVYRGVHESLRRNVAIKELLPQAARNKDAVSRFRREALALASFHHQNIVTVYDLIERRGESFLILEYVDGTTLLELLKQGPLPPLVVAVVGAQLAAALEHAHFHRIIHRDLKPANVMLSSAGEVKLMDFGIAHDEDLERLTRMGMAVGTPSYMSPEQVTGAAIDHRTDVYSLGVVLYECLAGTRAFSGSTPGEVFSRVRDGKFKALHRVVADVPAPLLKIIRRAMMTRPDARYQDARAMRWELETYLAEELPSSSAGLLVCLLENRRKISEKVALTRVSARELVAMRTMDSRRALTSEEVAASIVGGRGIKWAVATLLLAAGGAAGWFHDRWWPLVSTLIER